MTTNQEFSFEKFSVAWYEYIVFGVVLTISLGIGIFYGFFGTKNKTNEEFLMADRKMSVIPVTMSILSRGKHIHDSPATVETDWLTIQTLPRLKRKCPLYTQTKDFISGLAFLGFPQEIYFFGSQYIVAVLSFIPMTLALAYIYVPVYFDLQLTSAYEYFEWRFSRFVRILVSVLAIVQLMIFMPTSVLGPALALEQVADVNPALSAATIFLVCVIYSSVGGLKAVIWTDVLQATIMTACISIIAILGVYEVGGLGRIWNTSVAADRITFFNFDVDPRTRHTLLTSTVGCFFLGIQMFGATQPQIQRYNSVRSLKEARQSLVLNMCGLIIFVGLTMFSGLIIFTRYASCDPVTSKKLSVPDQLFPLFVMDVLAGKYIGLPGLLVAGITSASLSSVSSILNGIAVIIVEDFVKWFRPGLSESQLAITSKIISFVTGLLAFGMLFVIWKLNETISLQPFVMLLSGDLYGPIIGAYTIGMIFPWVTNFGALCGIILSILLSGGIGVGHIIAGMNGLVFNQRLPLRTDSCNRTTSPFLDHLFNNSTKTTSWKNEPSNFTQDVLNISFLWHPAISTLTTIVIGIVGSSVIISFRREKVARVNHSLLSKPFLKFWIKIFGRDYMNEWVDFDSPPFSGKPKSVSISSDIVLKVHPSSDAMGVLSNGVHS